MKKKTLQLEGFFYTLRATYHLMFNGHGNFKQQ